MMLFGAACSGSSATGSGPTTTAQQAAQGGTLSLWGAEPGCADWLASCGQVAAGFIQMARETVPRPLDYVNGRYQPTPLLAGEPVLSVGPPQRVTYKINPKAVWSDGAPITSADFRYSWTEGAKAPALTTTTGFDKIAGVDDSDPATAVVTFTEPYAAWRNLFAIVLPKHLLDGKDRNAETKDGYSWSGGPWVIDHWTRGQEIKLVRNPRFWGKVPNLDAVVWKVIPDSAAALAAYKSGQVSATIALPPEVTAADLRALPDTQVDVATTFGVNWVNFNTQSAPLDSVAARQALAYATDRDAIAAQVFGPLQPGAKAVQSYMTPAYGRWYVEPFARYHQDLAKVDQVMRADGWARGADGVWAKGGQRAAFEMLLQAGSKGADLATQILQSQWKAAGFDVTLASAPLPTLTDRQTKGTFQAVLLGFAFTNSIDDPGRCAFFCARNIPTAANGFTGLNTSRLSSPAVDDAWGKVDTETDDAKRLEAVRRANDVTADLVPALPLSAMLLPVVHSTARLRGPVTANVPSPYYNLNEWWCLDGRC